MAEIIGLIVASICILLIGLTYVVYPAIRLVRLKVQTEPSTLVYRPSVTIIFAAFNEKIVIEEKIRSIYNSDYELDKISVLIGSDMSNDGTDEIIIRLQSEFPNLYLHRTEKRTGKSGIMNILAEKATGEILIATDANIIFKQDTIDQLVRSFTSNQIGAVAGALTYRGNSKNGTAKNEGVYLNLENKIKLSESQNFGFCLGMEGGLYAIRKKLWAPIPPATFMEDFFQTMQLLVQNKAIKFNPLAIGYEDVSTSLEEEFKRKIRISLGNFQNLKRFKEVLWKSFFPLGYAFLLHKVLRWFTPHIIIVLLAALLLNPPTMFLGLTMLGLLLLQFILVKFNMHGPITYFCAMNLAMLLGHLKYLKGVSSSVWEPTKRIQE
jgi:cellulose synthase/poly-beta-1,6-N-acetylglucosamine synthase-like glycosyltransferase